MIILGRSVRFQSNVALPDDSHLPHIGVQSAMQGAVTSYSATVSAKMSSRGLSRLLVYSDPSRTQLVKVSNLYLNDIRNAVKFAIKGLDPDTEYFWAIHSGGMNSGKTGKFKTFPVGPSSHKIVASSCAGNRNPDWVSNHEVFDGIRTIHGDALTFIHMGDFHYLDIGVNNPTMFDDGIDLVLAQSRQQNLYLNIPLIYMFNDHDYGINNSDGSSPSKPAALSTYKRRIPHYPLPFPGLMEPACQTFVIGRVRYILLDVLSQRVYDQTYLGEQQKNWMKNLMLTCPEPVIGLIVQDPWITEEAENGWYKNRVEREELMDWFEDNNFLDRIFMFYGDTHMVAVDDGTNNRGIPTFCFSSLDSNAALKGGPYSHGQFPGYGQFGTFEITDDGGNTILVKGTGYSYHGSTQT